MAENISVHILPMSGVATMNMFLRRLNAGALLNTGGDALVESPAGSGRFVMSLTEARVGLGTLAVAVCDGVESAANAIWSGWLAEGDTVATDTFPQSGGGGGGGSSDHPLATNG
jgi:hypothetical protein